MESPYNRAKAANLIRNALDQHEDSVAKHYCGFSAEMVIYTKLKEAGFLTEDAMVSCCGGNDELCSGRQCAWGDEYGDHR